MLILTIRTDNPTAEIGLFEDDKKSSYMTWQAHRRLAETIHQKIEDLLKKDNKNWSGIQAIACYRGPGSFTGLRIGLTVANSLAYSLDVPIVGAIDDDWIRQAVAKLKKGENEIIAKPKYGAAANITQPKK